MIKILSLKKEVKVGALMDDVNEAFRRNPNDKAWYVGVVGSALRDSGMKPFVSKKVRDKLALKILDYLFGR